MDIKECYEMLGITKKATDEQVKKAYREKSKQFHPDLHRDDKDATAKFAKVSEAYRLILENREKKHKSIFNFQWTCIKNKRQMQCRNQWWRKR